MVIVTADGETEAIGGEAALQLAQAIVENQNVNLNLVSGASMTSAALLAAM